ncbi:hypothetical protein [Proteiniborus sp.]
MIVECIAIYIDDARIKDNKGNLPKDEVIYIKQCRNILM